MFTDDFKLCEKSMNELDSVVETTHIYSQNIGMEFEISKCAMIEMKRVQVVDSSGVDNLALESSDRYKYLGINSAHNDND